MKLSNKFFNQSLSAHSWLGLMVGGLMYLICLSGTLAVYFEEFERWEQPAAQEYFDYDIQVIDDAFNKLLVSQTTEITPHMYVTLPTTANPRVGLITENEGWFLDKDGSLGTSTSHEWTDVLTDLHLYLHLPKSWGMIFVSTLGVILLALIISGFASHRTLFKDAFKLRLFGGKQLEQTDIHNRLSVWGAPFHLMIALTGSFFGFAMVVLYAYSAIYQNNDVDMVTQTVFGNEPELNQEVGPIQLAKAIRQMPELSQDSTPVLVIVHDTGTPEQFIEIFSQYPNRLIYSDNFVFDANGDFLHQQGFSDGDTGKQIVYSMYRLHFGHFGSQWIKVLYFLLGLATTIISVSGINIWLAKRKYQDTINDVWCGFVWGTPLALIIPAITRFAFDYTSSMLFWATLLLASIFSCIIKNTTKTRSILKYSFAALSFLLIVIYSNRYGLNAWHGNSLIINMLIICTSLMLIVPTTVIVKKVAEKNHR